MIEKGTFQVNGVSHCENCKARLDGQDSVEFVLHWDGTKQFGYRYKCKNCGAIIEQVFDRSPEDSAWCGGDEE